MNYYHIWANHKPDVNTKEFATKMRTFLDQLVDMKKMSSYKLTRMKLGFRSIDLPEFHIIMEFDTMQQLDDAMTAVLENQDSVDTVHVAFNQLVDGDTIQHALYRDYPDE
jgi:methyltransferase-like protein